MQPIRAAVPTAAPQKETKPGADIKALIQLLRVEGDARAAASLRDLEILIVNEAAEILKARHVYLVRQGLGKKLSLITGSTVGRIDRTVPFMQELETELHRKLVQDALTSRQTLAFWSNDEGSAAERDGVARQAFQSTHWVPLVGPRGQFLAALLIARDKEPSPAELILVDRLATLFGHAVHWQQSKGFQAPKLRLSKARAGALSLALIAAACWPVALTTLAPFEIVAREPTIISAPLDGIIEAIPVDGSQIVNAGDELVRFVDIVSKNKLEVAEQEVRVAEARARKLAIAAVADVKARHELAQTEAELTVKRAERDYARDILARSKVTATRPGVVVIGDKREFIGRPISTGERLMELADPEAVEARIMVPVSDAIVLGDSKRVKFFLDSQPLKARAGELISTDYHARPSDAGPLAYRVMATIDKTGGVPRLGNRGVAQLYGDSVPLVYYLFRRPIAAARQWIGL